MNVYCSWQKIRSFTWHLGKCLWICFIDSRRLRVYVVKHSGVIATRTKSTILCFLISLSTRKFNLALQKLSLFWSCIFIFLPLSVHAYKYMHVLWVWIVCVYLYVYTCVCIHILLEEEVVLYCFTFTIWVISQSPLQVNAFNLNIHIDIKLWIHNSI